ncbi:Ribokinase-like protein [Chytriomyces sp. MP71]|nr:Ribokinase-like protein [Chytriomyces sp. MP71]
MRILCFGSLNIDDVFSVDAIVKVGETIACSAYSVFPGGKGANQSVALARAATGVPVHHSGCVGADGRWLVDLLLANGVDTALVRVLETTATGRAVIQRDKDGDNAIVIVKGANGAVPPDHVDSSLAQFGERDWLLVQNEVNSLDLILAIAKKDRGMKVLFNPAPCPSEILALPLHLVDILILNEGEAQTLYSALAAKQNTSLAEGYDSSTEKTLQSIMRDLPSLEAIVITLGEKGVVALHRYNLEHIIQLPALKDCSVVDTTGAGDTFVGYFLSNFVAKSDAQAAEKDKSQDAFVSALQIAVVASGIACEREGAIPSIPRASEVLERMESVLL